MSPARCGGLLPAQERCLAEPTPWYARCLAAAPKTVLRPPQLVLLSLCAGGAGLVVWKVVVSNAPPRTESQREDLCRCCTLAPSTHHPTGASKRQ